MYIKRNNNHNNTGDAMTKDEYKKLVVKHTAKVNEFKSITTAFLIGGFVGMMGELLIEVYTMLGFSIKDSSTYMIVTLIFLSCLFTSIGFFDKWVEKVRCGLIVPITGFAHAMMSAALEYKGDGFILGLGSNIFKITGSVILYGVVSAYVFGLIRLLIGG